ncbi:MFS transporter [Streptomyces venezuelae]|uniref:MFS transporter n=1 Tax=Streptomyces venezuelae TaxID=54571 RepID=UPI00278BEE13|nr:MFS transporter [Streptomyces venezuelae]
MREAAPQHDAPPGGRRGLPAAFRALMASEAVSSAGSQLTLVALPVLAAADLGASPSQIALLSGAQFVPVLLVTPFAGRLADLRDRAPLLYASHFARAAVLFLVVALAAAAWLNYALLFAAAVLLGAFTALFDTALLAYVPDTVDTDDLTRANGQLAAVNAVSQTAGPAVGGLVVSGLGPGLAVALDAVSYLFGGAALRARPKPSQNRATRDNASIRAGFKAVAASDPLRRLVAAGSLFNLAEQVALSVLFIAVVQETDHSVAFLGFGFSAAGIGSVIGARATARYGGGDGARSWVWALLVSQATLLTALWSLDFGVWGAAAFFTSMLVYGAAMAFYNVHSLTRRQLVSPEGMLGRVNAVYRTFAFGTIPIGAGAAALLLLFTSAPTAATLVAVLSVVATWVLARGTYTTERRDEAWPER